MSYSLGIHDAHDFKASLKPVGRDDGSTWFWVAEISWYSGEGKKLGGHCNLNFFFNGFEEAKEFAENMKLLSDMFYESIEHELSKAE